MQCNATISLKQFFDMVYEEPKKMLLYGDACRVSTDPIAKASYFFDLIQVSLSCTRASHQSSQSLRCFNTLELTWACSPK